MLIFFCFSFEATVARLVCVVTGRGEGLIDAFLGVKKENDEEKKRYSDISEKLLERNRQYQKLQVSDKKNHGLYRDFLCRQCMITSGGDMRVLKSLRLVDVPSPFPFIDEPLHPVRLVTMSRE